MKTLVSRFVKDESGATAIEYGLIAAGISVAIIAVVQGLGTEADGDLHEGFERAQLNRVRACHGEGSGGSGAFCFCRYREALGTIVGKSSRNCRFYMTFWSAR